ncbi:MAG: threonine/serine exporter family protein [Thermincolia bacterium]
MIAEHMKDCCNIDLILELLVEAGTLMLVSGAEIHRVEDTVERMGKALGQRVVEAFATPTGLIITVKDFHGNSRTEVKRIAARSINLNRVNLVNDMSRRLAEGKIMAGEVAGELRLIGTADNPYPTWVYLLSAGVCSGAFSFLFGGRWQEVFLALIVGLLIHGLRIRWTKRVNNRFFLEFSGGVLAAGLTVAGHWLYPGISVDKVIIGAIMTLVPGVAVTNAIRDVIHEDLISGVARGLEALLSAMAIASGVALVLGIWLS